MLTAYVLLRRLKLSAGTDGEGEKMKTRIYYIDAECMGTDWTGGRNELDAIAALMSEELSETDITVVALHGASNAALGRNVEVDAWETDDAFFSACELADQTWWE
jgi:hypothetical protein